MPLASWEEDDDDDDDAPDDVDDWLSEAADSESDKEPDSEERVLLSEEEEDDELVRCFEADTEVTAAAGAGRSEDESYILSICTVRLLVDKLEK